MGGKWLFFLRRSPLLGILLLFLLSGCSTAPTTTVVKQNALRTPQRILILPFGNQSDEENLGEIAVRICQDIYFNRGIELVNRSDLRIYLQRHHLFLSQLTKDATPEFLADLAHELNVTTLVKGEILTADYKEVQGEPLPVISLNLELINAANGKLIASSFLTGYGKNYRTVLRFGVLRTTTQLLEQMILEITDSWDDKGVFQ